MGVHFPSVASTAVANALPATATETAICTTPPLNLSLDNAQVILLWMAAITAGTSTTALVMRIRRGTGITGTLLNVGAWTFTTVAGNLAQISGNYIDTPGIVGGQQYSLTCSQTAASGAGTLNDVCLVAFVL